MFSPIQLKEAAIVISHFNLVLHIEVFQYCEICSLSVTNPVKQRLASYKQNMKQTNSGNVKYVRD